MGTPSNHPKSMVLDHCWICEARFVQQGGSANREDHHILPRAYGGVDGPTVTICSEHHSTVHRVGECLIHEKTYHQFLRGESTIRVQRIMYLASRIHEMYLKTKNDPNKAVTFTTVLTARHRNMIDALKPVLGARSREAVFIQALESLYKRHFVQ